MGHDLGLRPRHFNFAGSATRGKCAHWNDGHIDLKRVLPQGNRSCVITLLTAMVRDPRAARHQTALRKYLRVH